MHQQQQPPQHPLPLPAPPAGPCQVEVPSGGQCGGRSGSCYPHCYNMAWPGACCPARHICLYINEYFYQCRPY
jgi:hypothetical protein